MQSVKKQSASSTTTLVQNNNFSFFLTILQSRFLKERKISHFLINFIFILLGGNQKIRYPLLFPSTPGGNNVLLRCDDVGIWHNDVRSTATKGLKREETQEKIECGKNYLCHCVLLKINNNTIYIADLFFRTCLKFKPYFTVKTWFKFDFC